MLRKNVILMVCAGLLAGVYVYFFSDWFAPADIQIIHTIRPNNRPAARPGQRGGPRPSSHLVSFNFNRELVLEEIKVVPASAAATNKYPHPIWHLISDSNSVPAKSLVYGARLRGLRPAVKGDEAEPLEPSTAYKLFLKSDVGNIEHDFQTPASLPVPK